MKKMNIVTALVALCFIAIGCYQNAQTTKLDSNSDSKTVRIMSYNIRHGMGMDEVVDLDRTAKVILSNAPDILAVQEVDSVTERSNQVDILKELAQKVSMHYVFAPAIDFDGGKYGIGILSKEQPISSRHIALPGREEQRAFLMVEFKDYVYCCTHLSLTPDDQILSLPIIKEAVADFKKPVFIAGDLNAHPDSEVIGGLKKEFKLISRTDVFTCPASEPKETIDYIGVQMKDTAAVSVESAEVVNDTIASDHRPILSVVKLAVE